VLITGASRGIGAATAQILAQRGADVVINYRQKGTRAENIAASIRSLGRRALPVQADLTDETATRRMFDLVAEEFGKLDVLVLNASGGMERDMPSDYAMSLNRDAQQRAADLALPLIPAGGRIVFITSHQAHFYPQKPSVPEYQAVAASKRAGEDALLARRPLLAERGVRLVVVSGDMIQGTITATLLDRARPGIIEGRKQQAGKLPTIEEFAKSIADAAEDDNPDDTIFIGATT
jgi:NAD(P)-dependent dehydrogenase (short-subunit alcohol dehydrogenase family)